MKGSLFLWISFSPLFFTLAVFWSCCHILIYTTSCAIITFTDTRYCSMYGIFKIKFILLSWFIMFCPVCSNKDTKVTDSRVAPDGTVVRRRRECMKCGYRFSTYEEVELLDLMVVKRDGRREPYARDKLEKGMRESLEKRPFTAERFHTLINNIERDVQKKSRRSAVSEGRPEITSGDMGEIVMRRLKSFDKIAYIRYASVYRQFEDVETFQRELKELEKKKSKVKKSKVDK